MTEPIDVDLIGSAWIKKTFVNAPSVKRKLLTDWMWRKFCELCSDRTNQLDALGYVPSKWARDRFITDATIAYARYWVSQWNEEFKKDSQSTK